MPAATPEIAAIFNEAIALGSDEERARYLKQVCGDDLPLRARVEALLRAHSEAGGFFGGKPPAPPVNPFHSLTEAPGSVIGPYKILQQIGEGGMGVVYMAEQHEPVRRNVALKIIKPGMDTRQVIVRFEAERQALSLMDHPNIAKVLDAGTTEGGRPYFVMELVKGQPIADYCDEHHLTPRQRLELLLPVCQAIQHAHQKGIIHRDIKPSNILIAEYDQQVVPQVIDFGVAKAISQPLTEKTMFTGLGQIVGTLEYMSPEQAKVNQLDIDTRSDIYSLGVLMYELLTGSTPFDKQRLRSAAWDEMLRIIREEEPPRPSTKLSSSETMPSVSANRSMEPARLSRTVRGELDWIVMKALEKDRNRRYETANVLAMDIQRYLADEPVLACPPSTSYRLKKFARRNRVALTMATVVAIALVLGVVGTTWQAIHATYQRNRAVAAESLAQAQRQLAQQNADDANEARTKAEANFRQARQAVDDMYTQVAEKWLARQAQMEPLQREFLQKALQFYAEFARHDSTDPALRLESARAYRRVGDIQFRLGAVAPAEQALKQAITILQRLVDEFPDTPQYRQALAEALHSLGRLFTDTNRFPEGVKARRQALAVQEKLAADFPAVPEYRRDLARGQYSLADSLSQVGQHEEKSKDLRQSVTLLEDLVAEFPAVPEYRSYLAASHNALDNNMAALPLWEKLVTEFPTVPDYQLELSNSYTGLARLLPPAEAEKALHHALAIEERLVADFPSVADYRFVLLKSLRALSEVMQDSARLTEAERVYRRAVAVGEKLASDAPAIHYYRERLAITHADLAILLGSTGRLQEAEKAYRESIAVNEKLVGDFPNDTKKRIALSLYDFALGDMLAADNRPEEAEQAYRHALREWNKALEMKPLSTSELNGLAWDFARRPAAKLNDRQPALELHKKVVELAQQAVELAPAAGYVWNTLGIAQYRAGDWKAAIETLKEADELYQGQFFSIDAFFIAMAQWQLGDKDAARNWYTAALWMDKLAAKNVEQRRFRAEAANLIGPPDPAPVPDQPRPQVDRQLYTLIVDAWPAAAWAHLRRGQAHDNAGESQQAQADYRHAIDLYERAIQRHPKSWRLWAYRGSAYAELKQWNHAAADLDRAAELGAGPTVWYQAALAHLGAHDLVGYRQTCARIIARFDEVEDGAPADLALWACALGPDAAIDLAPATALAEQAVQANPKSARFLITLAALLSRAGRLDDAVQKLEEADQLAQRPGEPFPQAYTWFFLAMDHHRLGHTAEARKWFDLAREHTDQALKDHAAGTANLPWERRLTLMLFQRDAAALLGLDIVPVPPLEQREDPLPSADESSF